MLLPLMLLATLAFLAAQDADADEIRKPRVDLLGDPLPDGALVRIGSGRMRHQGYVRNLKLAFSPDGKLLASGGDRVVRIWEAATGKQRWRFRVDAAWDLAWAFTPAGLTVASIDKKAGAVTIQLLDPANGTVIRRVEMKERATLPNVTFSADGKRIAFTQGNTVRLGDPATGQEILNIPKPGRPAKAIAFAPDGKTIALDDFTDTIRLHDTTSGKCVRELTRHGLGRDEIHTYRLIFSPDGRLLVSFFQDFIRFNETNAACVRIWDVKTGNERPRLKTTFQSICCAAFCPDSRYLALGGDPPHSVALWDMTAGKESQRYSIEPDFVGSIAFAPDGKRLAIASGKGAIQLCDTATRRVLPASADRFLQALPDLRFSADGRRLLGRDDRFIAWNPHTGREIRRLAKTPDPWWTQDLSLDESLLAGGDRKGVVHLWDAKTGRLVRDLKGNDQQKGEAIRYTFFAPGGRRLLSCDLAGTVRIWDVASGRQQHSFANDNRTALAVSPDGRCLASAFRENGRADVLLWDLNAGRKKSVLDLPGNVFVNQMAFSPDSRLLAIAYWSDRGNVVPSGVFLWDVASGQQRRLLPSPNKSALEVAFSADGRMVASGHAEGTLILWELASGRRRHSFLGHETAISSLAFSPDRRLLAASSFDAPIYVWDVIGAIEPSPHRLSDVELQRCWTALSGEDASAAFGAIRRFVVAPERTLPLLRQHLKPVPAPDLKRVRQLVEMLDSADYATRQKATEELEKEADACASTLRQILAKEKPSLEVRRRLQQIVESIERKPEVLRAIRAVEVLEWIDTPEAVRLLDELAKGTAEARLTREASAARKRLRR